MHHFSNVTANTFNLIKIEFYREKFRHLIEDGPLTTYRVHLYLRWLFVFDEFSLLTFEKMIVEFMDLWLSYTVYVGFVYAEINSIQYFVNYVLVFHIFQPHKLLPLFHSIFLSSNLPHANLKYKWAVFLELVDTLCILLLLVHLDLFEIIWVKICLKLIIKCLS